MLFKTVLLLVLASTIKSMFISVETGFVGVEYVWNKITNSILEPGLHIYNPITSKISIVEIRPQKD